MNKSTVDSSLVASERRPISVSRRVVMLGTSADGLRALLDICGALPADFPAAVLIVLHIGGHHSQLPEILRRSCKLPARFAVDGEPVVPGRIYVAPPDHHLLLQPEALMLSRGPKENWTRPAIDPLFRSAALHWGECAIGVLLAGQLDDGVAGLHAIQQCGGTTVVQDPASANDPSMPRSAINQVQVDFCLPPSEIADCLQRLVHISRVVDDRPGSKELQREVAINEDGSTSLENVSALGRPSPLTCPECGGTLFEIKDEGPLRYRCHTGHAFSALSLAAAQDVGIEDALRSGARALQEREMLLRRLAAVARSSGRESEAIAGERKADEVRAKLGRLIRLIQEE